MDHQAIIADFLGQHHLGVIATVAGAGQPQAAVIEYGVLDGLELVIDTLTESRKYHNILTGSSVAVAIGWDNKITVQYEGVASVLSGDELHQARERYFTQNARAKRWADRPGVAYIKISPRWIRYADYSQDPWQVFEITL